MKKIIFLAAFAFASITSFSQSLQKGNLIGLHTTTVKLNGKTTMKQYVDFVTNKWAPAMSNAVNGEVHVLKYLRGDGADKISFIFVFKTEADRNKFYNSDGSSSALGKTANAKMKTIDDELSNLGNMTGGYTDWLVQ